MRGLVGIRHRAKGLLIFSHLSLVITCKVGPIISQISLQFDDIKPRLHSEEEVELWSLSFQVGVLTTKHIVCHKKSVYFCIFSTEHTVRHMVDEVDE